MASLFLTAVNMNILDCFPDGSASGTNWKNMINSCGSPTTANLSTGVLGLAAACPEWNVQSATGSRPRDAKVRWGGGVAADVCADVEEIVDGEVS